ncbi:hypothetical protein C4D60_Mb03t11450 [Musa balbisiana]|uniref:Uncharacterized protein n=1 Tax=Musa balbisiana TaxID=52838 RepID=A0A4S8J997_MUSBA|nr:hypothetical protein C4D60_Mb03t11450 [Musa balbisiana]
MNGHLFDGRRCLVALASPYTIQRMGENQMNKNQQMMAQSQLPALTQKNRGSSNFGRGGGGGGGGGNWERGDGTGNRGSMGNTRNRMGTVNGRGIMGNGGIVAPPPPVLHPGVMFGQGFATRWAAMGRMGPGFEGFPAAACDNAVFLKLIHGPHINGSGPSKACWFEARRDTMEIFDYRKNFSTVT